MHLRDAMFTLDLVMVELLSRRLTLQVVVAEVEQYPAKAPVGRFEASDSSPDGRKIVGKNVYFSMQ